jgi:hypothetical protein
VTLSRCQNSPFLYLSTLKFRVEPKSFSRDVGEHEPADVEAVLVVLRQKALPDPGEDM